MAFIKSLAALFGNGIIDEAKSHFIAAPVAKLMSKRHFKSASDDDCENFLKADLYIKPLTVKKQCADEILSSLARSNFPVVTGIDAEKLNPTAKECFKKDRREFNLFNFLTHSDKKDYMFLI